MSSTAQSCSSSATQSPVHAVDVIAVEMRDERLDAALEPGKRMWPVVLADRGDLVAAVAEVDELRRDDVHHVAAIVAGQAGQRHPAGCGDVVHGGAAGGEVEPLRPEFGPAEIHAPDRRLRPAKYVACSPLLQRSHTPRSAW